MPAYLTSHDGRTAGGGVHGANPPCLFNNDPSCGLTSGGSSVQLPLGTPEFNLTLASVRQLHSYSGPNSARPIAAARHGLLLLAAGTAPADGGIPMIRGHRAAGSCRVGEDREGMLRRSQADSLRLRTRFAGRCRFSSVDSIGKSRFHRAEARFPCRFIGTPQNFPTGLPVEISRASGCEPLDTLLATRNYGSANTTR